MSGDVPIAARLAMALSTMSNPSQTASSHHGKYVPLGELLDHVRPVLAEQGLAVSQHISDAGCTTVVYSVDGDRLELGTYPVAFGAQSQANGSAVTYARRYGLAAALGVFGDADDDGAAASKPKRVASAPRGGITQAQLKALQASWSSVERAERLAAWSQIIGRAVGTANELTKAEAGQILEART